MSNTNTYTNIDFDSLLNLEDQFYQNSFNNAINEGKNHSNRDGIQFGIQTGFQRFILIGALNKMNHLLIDLINSKLLINHQNQNQDQDQDQKGIEISKKVNLEKMIKNLTEIQKNINYFYNYDNNSTNLIQTSNTPNDVQFYEKQIKIIRSKIKSAYLQLGYKNLYSEIENSCREIAGDIPASQINGAEEDIW